MKKGILLMLVVLIPLLVLVLFKSNTYSSRVNEEDVTVFVEENVEILDKIKDIALLNKERLHLSPEERIWTSLNGDGDKVIDTSDEINILYDKLLGMGKVRVIYEGTLKDDKSTKSYPVIRFETYNKVADLTYQTIGFMYIDTEEILDVSQYRCNDLVHIMDKWYYFELPAPT